MPEIFSKVVKGKLRRLRFRFPRVKLTRETIKQSFALPKRFCGTCSLREGSAVMITVFELIAGVALTVAVLMLEKYPKEIDDWWEQKLKNDFKPAFGEDFKDYPRRFKHVWRSVAWSIVGICSSYIFFGLGVIFGLLRKRGSLLWFLPWLFYTFLLLVASYLFVGLEMTFVIIFTMRREVTITQEIMPIVLSMLFAGTWTYGFLVVVAHVKKRYTAEKLAKIKKQEMVLRRKIMKAQLF